MFLENHPGMLVIRDVGVGSSTARGSLIYCGGCKPGELLHSQRLM
jgi:hypothetical protein